jgi:chemotaxis protein methyltransferase CheR
VSVSEREFKFTEKDFQCVRNLVTEHAGIYLSDAKKDLVYSRLSKRIRKLGFSGFRDYCEYLKQGHEDELVNFVNAITTNLTSFFREKHHFEYLKSTVMPRLLQDNAGNKRIRIWSAGCSIGEEPYSLAMTVKEALRGTYGWDVKILATDLDTNVIEKAKSGVYAKERIEGLDQSIVRKWFKKGSGKHQGLVRVHPELKDLITFKQLNLMNQWPMKGPFDVIFCRNVVIYFDKATQKVLFNRYADILRDEGNLFIGHSETLFKVSTRFKLIGNTIYRKL